VGDIIQINSGMQVPVDGIVIKGMGVLTNESAMTGEPDEMKKESLDLCK
jgi:Cu+-exporting ATPase